MADKLDNTPDNEEVVAAEQAVAEASPSEELVETPQEEVSEDVQSEESVEKKNEEVTQVSEESSQADVASLVGKTVVFSESLSNTYGVSEGVVDRLLGEGALAEIVINGVPTQVDVSEIKEKE